MKYIEDMKHVKFHRFTNYKLASSNSLISSEDGFGAFVDSTLPLASNNMNLGILKIA